MDSGNEPPILGEFDALFKRSVPHILERIFFSLDYDSFSACDKVCKVWNDLLSSESYIRKSCELLLEKVDNEERLCEVSEEGNVPEVARLLSSGVNPNCEKAHTSLTYAAIHGHTEVLKLLLRAGTDPNMAKLNREPLILLATYIGHKDMVQLLLDGGADLKKTDEYGKTPLHLAAFQGNRDVVQLLLYRGADPNRTDRWGRTPLSHAALYINNYELRNKDIVKMLTDAMTAFANKNRGK